MTTPDTLSLREASEALGLASSTVRRHIRAGRLRAVYVAGPFGHEFRVAHDDLATFVGARQAAGFVWARGARPVEDATLGELLQWAQQPAVRIASTAWARTAATVTAGTVLAWIREQLGADRAACYGRLDPGIRHAP